jgi:hypothetical protein
MNYGTTAWIRSKMAQVAMRKGACSKAGVADRKLKRKIDANARLHVAADKIRPLGGSMLRKKSHSSNPSARRRDPSD